MDQALNSQKTPHTSPLRASYGMSFVSILMKNDRVIKGFYCTSFFIPVATVNTVGLSSCGVLDFVITSYRQTSNMRRIVVGNKIVDHTDVIHLHSRLDTRLQWIEQRQRQDETRIT